MSKNGMNRRELTHLIEQLGLLKEQMIAAESYDGVAQLRDTVDVIQKYMFREKTVSWPPLEIPPKTMVKGADALDMFVVTASDGLVFTVGDNANWQPYLRLDRAGAAELLGLVARWLAEH